MLIYMLIKNEHDQVHKFQYIYRWNSQKYLKVIMYHLELTSYDICLYFVSPNTKKKTIWNLNFVYKKNVKIKDNNNCIWENRI